MKKVNIQTLLLIVVLILQIVFVLKSSQAGISTNPYSQKFIIVFSLLIAVVGAVVGAIATAWYQNKARKYNAKINTLKSFAGYRYDLKGEKFTKSLNEIFIIFQDSKVILKKLDEFHNVIVSKNNPLANQKLIALFKAMCKDVNINPDKYTESFFLRPFNVKEISKSRIKGD